MQNQLPTWEELSQVVPDDLLDQMDQLLVDYETSWQFGTPDRIQYLVQCPDEHATGWLVKELDHIDDYYLDMQASATGGRLNHIGRFKIIDEIGSGSDGVVLKAIDFATDEIVAIKIPRLPWRVQNSQERLQTESDILKSLDHPNIVKYVDSGFIDGYWFVATEWIDGGTLQSAIDEVQIPVEQCLDIAIQVANALQHGHHLGVVHQDIKPGNILLHATEDERTEVKVFDYGLARLSTAERLRQTETFLNGTLDYIAPERANGVSDARSDIFSLGIVLIKMLRTSYGSSNLVPKPIRRIFRKATDPSPEKRYQSVGQFRDELDDVLQNIQLGIIAKTRPNPWLKTTAALVIAIFFLLGLMMSPQGIPVASIAPPHPPKFESPKTTPYKKYFNDEGLARIFLKTNPPGATISIYCLNNSRGEPRPQDEIFLGVSPINDWIMPGDYFVVVAWPQGNHHEVLRRVPHQKTDGVPPIHFVDMFEPHELGIQLKTVHAPSPVLVGMNSNDSCWYDPTPFPFAADKLRSFHISSPAKYSLHGYRTSVSLMEAATKLEKQGKRLPFLSELLDFVGDANQLTIDEWTATWSNTKHELGDDNEFIDQYGEFVTATAEYKWGRRREPEFMKRTKLGFRGVRSKTPFKVAHVDLQQLDPLAISSAAEKSIQSVR